MDAVIFFMPTDADEHLDSLTRAITAFDGWEAFEMAMHGGYAPTIHPDSRRKRILRKTCHAFGFPIYPPFGRFDGE